MDPNELDKQVKEKREREQQERKLDQKFADKQLTDAILAMEFEKEENDVNIYFRIYYTNNKIIT